MTKEILPEHHLEAAIVRQLVAARKRAGLTQAELADKMGYPYHSGPGKIESHCMRLTIRYFLHAADALGIPPEEILAKAAGKETKQ